MNRDQVKGGMKDASGKLQRKIGEVTGNKNQQVKGAGKQVEGKVQKYVGNAKEDFKDDDKDY
ncbi:MAG: CsbD family protein [Acidiferrobacterales bacterium]